LHLSPGFTYQGIGAASEPGEEAPRVGPRRARSRTGGLCWRFGTRTLWPSPFLRSGRGHPKPRAFRRQENSIAELGALCAVGHSGNGGWHAGIKLKGHPEVSPKGRLRRDLKRRGGRIGEPDSLGTTGYSIPATFGCGPGIRRMGSPSLTSPPETTLAKRPSVGMMQSPAR